MMPEHTDTHIAILAELRALRRDLATERRCQRMVKEARRRPAVPGFYPLGSKEFIPFAGGTTDAL